MPRCWPQGPRCWHRDHSRAASCRHWQGLWELLLFSYLLCSSVHTHKHTRAGLTWHRNPILACMRMFVRKCRRIVCVYFLNKYRCMLWLAFDSSVMVFIVSLCVGDRPLGQRLTWMTEERNTRCAHTNACMCTRTHKPATFLLAGRPESSQTFPHSQPLRADTVLISQICQQQSIGMRTDASY